MSLLMMPPPASGAGWAEAGAGLVGAVSSLGGSAGAVAGGAFGGGSGGGEDALRYVDDDTVDLTCCAVSRRLNLIAFGSRGACCGHALPVFSY